MAKQSTMHFSIPNWSSNQSMPIGTVGETVWSVQPDFDGGYGKGSIEVCRSIGQDEVEIDVEVKIKTFRIVSAKALPLRNGREKVLFECYIQKRNMDYAMVGYVTVRYDSDCPLTSKKDAVAQAKLVSDLLHLFDNPDSFSDATLVCGTAKIPVHRNILSARSLVFAAMFQTQMQEGRDGVVDIVDMEPDVLQAMLRYVYSGQTDHLTHSLAEMLLFAADKYQLEELKMMCIEALKVSMDANNVLHSLVLGDLHDENLKACAVEFICKYKNFSDLEKTEEWQSLLKERPSLVIEVMTTALKYLQNK